MESLSRIPDLPQERIEALVDWDPAEPYIGSWKILLFIAYLTTTSLA
jgi:hypothetical protein